MFQDTLLIIKPDYLVKRKSLLVYLLKQGFLIKGQRKTCFSPELAAEFYEYRTKDCCFMFKVILLSKGNSEAFVLAKEYAVEELKHVMVCYFGTPDEMEENVHVTQCPKKVQREISFIFPNYFHEPVIACCPEEIKSCVNTFLVESTINTLNDIVRNPEKGVLKRLKQKLAESLILPNRDLPEISNQCCHSFELNAQDTAQKTKINCVEYENRNDNALGKSLSTDFSKNCSSFDFTTSSCVSCSSFGSGAGGIKQQSLREPLVVSELSTTSRDHAHRQDITAADFSELVKDKFLCNDQAEKEKTQDTFKVKAFNQSVTLVNNLKLRNDIPRPDFVNQPFLVNEFSDKKFAQSSNGENEQNKKTNEEISLLPK